MAYRDPETGRARDRERFARRTAERRAAGLCPRCGERPPAPGRSACELCGEKRRAAGRARDARLRAAGKPRRDPEKARAAERRRYRRQVAGRQTQGACTRCGQAPAAPERTVCESCGKKRREADRARYAAGKAAGKLYGGRDPDAKRRNARTRSGKRQHDRRDAGPVHPMRAPATRRVRHDLRAVPDGEAGGRARGLRCPPVRGPLWPVRRADRGRRFEMRPLRRARSRTRFA